MVDFRTPNSETLIQILLIMTPFQHHCPELFISITDEIAASFYDEI